VLQSAGLLFFAFAGYARLATLGEEVATRADDPAGDPHRARHRGGRVYAVCSATAARRRPGRPRRVAGAAGRRVEGGRWAALAPVVRVGAAVAAAGVLLSLLAGISRTALSMARRRELPGFLDAVHPRTAPRTAPR
jgi:basic amino acid/polyamine antiporter, APA family